MHLFIYVSADERKRGAKHSTRGQYLTMERDLFHIDGLSHIKLELNGKINTLSVNKRAGKFVMIANFEQLLVWTSIISLRVCQICANAGFLKQLSSFKQANTAC